MAKDPRPLDLKPFLPEAEWAFEHVNTLLSGSYVFI